MGASRSGCYSDRRDDAVRPVGRVPAGIGRVWLDPETGQAMDQLRNDGPAESAPHARDPPTVTSATVVTTRPRDLRAALR
jgi:hypothetical protein